MTLVGLPNSPLGHIAHSSQSLSSGTGLPTPPPWAAAMLAVLRKVSPHPAFSSVCQKHLPPLHVTGLPLHGLISRLDTMEDL